LQVLGDYELLEKIAEGGMGAVYKARRRGSVELAAVKVLPVHLAKNVVLLKRFEQEYNAASTLNHPNIVRALHFGQEGDSRYLVMEFVEGESLGKRLERDRPLPEAEAIRIIAQVASGLQKAHKAGLVHRDVKPDNILLTRNGVAKLADLGLVKEVDNDLNLTRTGRGLGTPHYMAPEQFRDAKHVDARSDVYSLAATLYVMVTGEVPFKSLGPIEAWTRKVENKLPAPREIVPALSERVDWAIRRAMRGEPTQRPASCSEFVEDLTGHSTKPIIAAAPTGQEVWYLRFKDDNGVSHTAQESLMSVRRALKQGLLSNANDVRASRNPNGPFEFLRRLPEFRDLLLPAGSPGALPDSIKKVPADRLSPAASSDRRSTPSATKRPLVPQAPRPSPDETRRLPRPNLSAQAPQPATASVLPAAPPGAAPHVILDSTRSSFDWGRTLILLILASVTGVAGYLLLPQFLSYLRFLR
jgi:serine/threonine protein kinase